jgi:hypothetical protein
VRDRTQENNGTKTPSRKMIDDTICILFVALGPGASRGGRKRPRSPFVVRLTAERANW